VFSPAFAGSVVSAEAGAVATAPPVTVAVGEALLSSVWSPVVR